MVERRSLIRYSGQMVAGICQTPVRADLRENEI